MVLSMDRWVGKVAVVTGASSGIGAAIADQLVDKGLIVAGIARRAELIEKRAKELQGRKGKLHAVKADMTKEEDILKAFEWIAKNLGPVHILVNNAGTGKTTNLIDGDTEIWKHVLDLNVLGLCVATREAVKVMKANAINGHVIHINSVLGHAVLNIPHSNVYPASKFAVTALTETLRQELNQIGSKIKVTVVGIARRVDLIEEHSRQLCGKKGKLHAVKADITREEDIVKAFEWIGDNLGPVHILVNNAGYMKEALLTEIQSEDLKKTFDINVLGLCIATREAIRIMKANDIKGHIVHINSILGHAVHSAPRMNVYPASKFAVTALTETLRQELNSIQSKIKITSVSPGLVYTEMTVLNKDITEERRKFLQSRPILKPEDIADGVVYALSTPEHVQVLDYCFAFFLSISNFFVFAAIMVLSMDKWVGKVAIVTGASSGIGASIADALVENGVIVVGLARRIELMEERSKQLSGKKGKLYAVKTDVTQEEDILQAFKWVSDNLGPVHILINNAGVTREGFLSDGKTEDWKKQLDVNVLGLCIATREAVRIMRANGIEGHIIHINSITGHAVPKTPKVSVYPATKHAVTALTETLRQELNSLRSRIKITSVSPGLVCTEMTALNRNNSEERRKIIASRPILQPEDIADGVIYVLSTSQHVQVHDNRNLTVSTSKMVLSMDRWVGKVAIVTGASSGIGAAIADQLVEKGLIVAGIARRSELIEQRAKALSGKKGKLHAVKADLTKEEDILKAFQWVAKNLGPVHVLVNNAGTGQTTSLTDGSTEIWKKALDLNVLGLCIATREAVKIMKANNINGHIIHINSIFGHNVPNYPNLNVYPASKYAVTALTETLRQELNQLGSKIRITSVSPGLVESELTTLNKKLTPNEKTFLEKMPILKGEDIADGVIYILSTPEHVQVAGIDLHRETIEEHAKKLSGKKGKLHAVEVDITKEENLLRAFESITKDLGPVHILVNCAGTNRPTTLADGKTEFWKLILDLNVLALCVATREAVKIMKANNINGHIIHINSSAGHYVPRVPNLNVYAASKHAVTALTETLRQELNQMGSKIRVTSVSPGLVATGLTTMNKTLTPEKKAVFAKAPIMQGEDVADSVVYVLSTPEHVQVAGIDLVPELIEERAKKLSGKKGQLHAIKADITKEDKLLETFEWINKNLGPVHILVNCAGTNRQTYLIDGNTEFWKLILDLNVLALCVCTREAVKIMRANNINGHIIHINSSAGHYVPNVPTLNVYAASKHAVTALTETLRQELNRMGSKIKVTSVSPGLVDTGLTTQNKDLKPETRAAFANAPIIKGEDIADGVVYVLSTPEHVQVVGIDLRPELIEERAKKLSGKKGQLHAVKCDLIKEEEILEAFDWITKNLGPVHILVNCAGTCRPTNLTDGDTESWRLVLDLNVVTLCICTREAVKIMKANNINGHIVHLNSVRGHSISDFPDSNVYPASKYAITALTETLRRELNQMDSKIKVTSVSPGLVATELTTLNKKLTPEKKALFGKAPTLKGEDIADGVVYVLSTPEHVQVAGIDVRPELIEEHAKKLSGKKGKLHAVRCDLIKEEEILKVFDWITKNLGPVHILVNCAGTLKPTTLADGNTEFWKYVLNLNVLALCICTREAVKIMKAKNINGHIIHINSIAGHSVTNGVPNVNVYPASKHAVTALTETLRQELNQIGSKIKVTSVSPGLVATELTSMKNVSLTADLKTAFRNAASLRGEDIADGVIYALSTPEHVQVAGIARRSERIQQRAKELSGKKGKLHAVKADISKEEDNLKAFEWITKNLGPVHILVNNAGTNKPTNLVDGNTEFWREIINVNVLALCIATREAVKIMKANTINGHIVHINSIGGHYVPNLPNVNVYAASKHAVTALTETLRQELNQMENKIKVTSVSPGLVATELTTLNKNLTSEKRAIIEKAAIIKSEDIADGVLYVLSTPEHVQVAGVDVRPELIEEHAKKLSGKKGKLHAIRTDLLKEEEILKAFESITKSLGPVHILVNCAGTCRPTNLTDGNIEFWKYVLNLNVLALCICTREAVKIMKANNINGHIIHINSVVGHSVPSNLPDFNVYPASKHAVTALTETLRQEFNQIGSKIKVTSVSPGLVATELSSNKNSKFLTSESKAAVKNAAALRGEDIADGVIYALSTPEHVQSASVTALLLRALQ
ncbi:adh short, KR, Epimerase, and/or NAD binding 10 domain containing protein [Asbolus verrucosus]|uniref:Adh short, KR, Epimerase, and/or NAD binding 10 domain containing protein n=1 Tax=Asbolus verrucosus TaxID=1661398 RepID=A0A482WBI0_ASBVE|nr:adh short, KR, Epimerase, and/or NAD binding 10 domain containing protein [Asbolus verrucosus]